MVVREQNDFALSHQYLEETLALQQAADDSAGMAFTLHNLGFSYQVAGEVARASALYNDSLALARSLDDQWTVYWNLFQLATLLGEHGHYDEAEALLAECYDLAGAWGYPLGQSRALGILADVQLGRGNLAAAQGLLEQTLQLYGDVGDRRSAVQNALELGWIMLTQEQCSPATDYFRRALREATTFNLVPQMLEGLLGLAHIRLATGDAAPRRWVGQWLAALSAQPNLLERALLNPCSSAAYQRLTAAYGDSALPLGEPAPDLDTIVAEALHLADPPVSVDKVSA
jgi:tetratricopeptide (TPR) repeat protein